jgi:hypothetical protein
MDVVSRLMRSAIAVSALCVAVLATGPGPASAAGTVELFATGASSSQAGGHPNLTIASVLANPGAPETAKALVVDEPAGLSAYMYAVPRCSLAALAVNECSPSSQVGLATTRALFETNPLFLYGTAPIYSVATGSGEYGRLAFTIPTLGFTQSMQVGVRSGTDVGMRLTIPNLPSATPLRSLFLQLWGVPADPAHDDARFPLGSDGCAGIIDTDCLTEPTSSSAPLNPLTGYPGFCPGGTLPVSLRLETYQDPGGTTTASSTLPGPTGCPSLAFDSQLDLGLATASRTVTGLDLDLTVPQDVNPATPTQSPAKTFAVDFGGGLRLDQDLANEYPACTVGQAALLVEGPGSCPAETKLGTVRIGTPLVPEMLGGGGGGGGGAGGGIRAVPRQAPAEITGSAYFGGVQPGAGYRVYLLGSGFGIDLKLALLLVPDPQTGALEATMNLPKFPIEQVVLSLYPTTGLLRTAVRCGDYGVASTVSPWNTSLSPVDGSGTLSLVSGPGGSPCPGPAASAHVGLAPSQVLADGEATTTATATVLDADQIPVPGEDVVFSSTDPDQEIGPVTDNEDGTYSAAITATTTVGTPQITATVTSADPELSASALLHQVAKSPPAPPPPPPSAAPEPKIAIPKVRIGKHPPAKSRKRKAVFTFSSDVDGSTFFCKVDGGPKYRRCYSPTTVKGLKPGKHRLRVYAVSPTGATGVPTVVKFTVLPPKAKTKAA